MSGRGPGLMGHRRICIPQGNKGGGAKNAAYRDGWIVSCICGWNGGHHPNGMLSRKSYSGHIDSLLKGKFLCRRCGEYKYLTDMRPDFRFMCLRCFSEKGNEWQKANPGRAEVHKRRERLMKNYGITISEWDDILASQGGVCAICRKEIHDPRGWKPHVDHDHATDKVRGILCWACNGGLGGFKDNPEYLRAAIAYLEDRAKRDIIKEIQNASVIALATSCWCHNDGD